MKLIMDEHDGETVARLPVQVRSTEYYEGESAEARSVHCPLSKGSVPLAHCMDCKRYAALVSRPDGDCSLWCRVPVDALEESVASRGLAERLARTQVAEVMTSKVTCVDLELNLDEVARVFEKKHIRAAPVVEDEGVLLGMVSKSDLVRGSSSEDQDDEGELDRCERFPPNCVGVIVDDIMTTDVVKLRETASLAEAAKVFATRGVHHIPVVTTDNVVVGFLSVVDLVRWMANQPEVGS